MNSDDIELLRRYVTEKSESAFAELVRRHIDLVYSAALRQAYGDGQQAEDITQAVFTDLARKSPRLVRHTSLTGWLYTSTRYAAASARRTEQRRSIRERELHLMNQLTETPAMDPEWEQVRPILDEVMHELKEADREAILLRFFERLPLSEVGSRLGVSENTARMRVERALEKLRARLALRGVTSAAAALGTALAQEAVGTAPANLAPKVAVQATTLAGAAGTGMGIFGAWTLAGKLGLATGMAVVIGAALLGWKLYLRGPGQDMQLRAETGRGNSDQAIATGATIAPDRVNGTQARSAGARISESGTGPELFFVDDQTGLPITNRVAWLKGWERGSQLLVEKTVQLEEARCVAPFDRNRGPGYWVLTHIESYADVMLKWQPQRGEVIPDSYIVRLVRPVLIHGRVVGPAGEPLAGAEVAFGNNNIPGSDTKPESHAIEHLTAKTDAEGRWAINRVAADCLPFLTGAASHPSYAQSAHVNAVSAPEITRQLRDGTFVFRLGEGIVVEGTVVDPSGQPVGAALVNVGMLDETGSRNAQTSQDGSFRVAGCRSGTQIVTASAEGFAPAAVSLELRPNLAPVKLTLGVGRLLKVRVVDDAGQPIVGARLWYNPFPRRVPGARPQVEFLKDSDSGGLIAWEHAPDLDLEFDCHASGHMRVSDLTIHPDDQEHVITLPPALVVSGTVRDTETGELIPRFRMGIGWPEPAPDGTQQPRWSTIDRFWPMFTGGKFTHSLEEPLVGGTENRGYIFRFEAEGYAPLVTRAYRPDEGEVTLDIKLRKSGETLVGIFTPQGTPANDAQVGLLAPGCDLRLAAGGFSTQGSVGPTWLRKADGRGQFVLPEDDTVQRIVIAHPEGYLDCTLAELRKSRSVQLKPWSRLEGVWLEQGEPAANREVSLAFSRKAGRPMMDLEYSAYRTTTDENGRFVFSQVPTGSLDIVVWRKSTTSERSFGSHAQTVEIQPGETRQVKVVVAKQP